MNVDKKRKVIKEEVILVRRRRRVKAKEWMRSVRKKCLCGRGSVLEEEGLWF